MRAAATPADHPAAADPRAANIAYHDWQSAGYEDKWGISYDERCIRYAVDRFRRICPEDPWPYESVLEIGAGTGFFLLNLLQAGLAARGTVTDIAPGMVAVATANATTLGFTVDGEVADAEALGLASEAFDLVIGHAVLHHIPDVEAALREVLRVLRPGGRFVFTGEPNRVGERIVRRLCRIAWATTVTVTRLPGVRQHWARPPAEREAAAAAAALESVVDLHTFSSGELIGWAQQAGAVEVRAATVEATAAWFGWPVRTVEAAIHPDRVGWGWAQVAYRGWLAGEALDRFLAPVLPDDWHYAVALTGRKPAAGR